MSAEPLFHSRYRQIYVADERPGARLLRCRDEQTGRLALVAELPAASPADQSGLAALAEAARSAEHPMLAPLIDHFAEGERYYLVCNDPGGQDLERSMRARGGPLAAADVVRQLQPLLALVEQLHTRRPPLMLGDPTPADLWLSDTGELRLLPFSLVRPVSAGPSPYRAIEIAEGRSEPSEPSDMYALGALSYLALTGWAPPSAEQLKAGQPITPPRTLNPSIPPLAEQAVLRALQLRGQNRYQRAREMRIALEAAEVLTNMPAVPGSLEAPPPAPPAAPPAGYAPPPLPGAAGYAPPPPPEAPRAGMSTGCIVALVVGIVLAAVAACIVAALIFTPLRTVVGLGGPAPVAPASAAPTAAPAAEATAPPAAPAGDPLSPAVPTPQPIVLGDQAITIASASTITVTRVITTPQFGPIAYAPDGQTVAVGIGPVVEIRAGEQLESQARLTGHSGQVTSLAWSSDGSLLATGSGDDNDIRIYDAATRTLRSSLSGHTGYIRSLSFAPSGATLASGGADQTIRLWDARTGTLLRTIEGHEGMLGGVAFSPDGARLASASRDGTVRLWDVATGAPVEGFAFQTDFEQPGVRYWTTGVAFSPDGGTLAVGSRDANIYLIDAATGKEIRRLVGHSEVVVIRGVAFSPDGKRLYTASLDSTIKIWDVAAGTLLTTLAGHQGDIFAISLNPNGKQLLSASSADGVINFWDVEQGQRIGRLAAGFGEYVSIAFAPDSRSVGLSGTNGLLQVQRDQQQATAPIGGPAGAPRPLAFVSSTKFAFITNDPKIYIADLSTGDTLELTSFSGQPYAIAASRDGRFVAVAGEGKEIVIWDAATGEVARRMTSELEVVSLLEFSYSGDRLAAAGIATAPEIEIWPTGADGAPERLLGPERPFNDISFQPGGTLLAASSLDGTLRIWDITTGMSVRRLTADQSQGIFAGIAFSPDGTIIATGALNGALQLWEVGSGTELARISLPARVLTLDFAPDGATLAASTAGGEIQLLTRPAQ